MSLLVQHQAHLTAPSQIHYATDLSLGGLFIHTPEPVDAGTVMNVQFAPQKDSRLVSAYCRVARVTPTGMGAEFVQMSAEDRALLRRVLSN
jgi:PilZ domain-containing protein